MTQKILVLGDSHSRAVRNALNSGEAELSKNQLITVRWVKFGNNGDTSPEEALDLARALTSEDMLVLAFSGTIHNILGLIKTQRPFDFFEGPGDQVDTSKSELISYSLIYSVFYGKIREDKRIEAFSSGMQCPVFFMMPPPPKGDNDFIASNTSSYRGNEVTPDTVNPPNLRAKLWRLEYKALSDVGAEMGIRMLPAIAEAQTDCGFLRAELYANDATHANSDYGRLVIRQLGIAARG